MPLPALFPLYIYLFGAPELYDVALALVRLAHLVALRGPIAPSLRRQAELARSAATLFAGSVGVLVTDLADAQPLDLPPGPEVPPVDALRALRWLIDLVEESRDRHRASTPQARWEALMTEARALGAELEASIQRRARPDGHGDSDPARRPTDPAPPPVSGEVPCG